MVYNRGANILVFPVQCLMINYSEKPENNVKMSKSFKKLAEADKKGQLEKELIKA